MTLESWSGVRVGEDVALDERLAVRAVGEAFLKVVCRTLALELLRLCLQCPIRSWSALFACILPPGR